VGSRFGARLLCVGLHLSSPSAVYDAKSVKGVGRQGPERLDAWLAITGPVEGQRRADIGVVADVAARTAPRGVLGAAEEQDRAVGRAPLLLSSRCGAVVAVVATQVDSGGSPQRTAFPGGRSRKYCATA
jgi:hypothetical protein